MLIPCMDLNKACLKSRIDINRGSYQAHRFGELNYQLKGAELHEKRAPGVFNQEITGP